MSNPRARGRAKHASKQTHRPSKNPLVRILLSCLVAVGIAIPAAAIAQSGHDSHGDRSRIAGDSWWNQGPWLTHWRDHLRHQPGGGGPGTASPTQNDPPPTTAPTTSAPSTSTPPTTTTPTTTAPTTTTPPAPGGGRILLGSDGNREQMESMVGHPLARHYYGDFSSSVPAAEFYTLSSGGYTWRQVANMQPGSSIYNNVVRWAKALGARGGNPMLAYSHEPTQSSRANLGGAADFKDAFRKVVTVMRSHGAGNVRYTWQMVGWSFLASSSDPGYAAKWYPGEAYVDVVGPDEYNWYTCGEGRGKWNELSTLVKPALAFARAHGDKLALPEFASYTDGRRASWIQNAHQYLRANRDTVVAIFYFHRAPTNKANMDCVWALQRQGEYNAYGAMANDPVFRHR